MAGSRTYPRGGGPRSGAPTPRHGGRAAAGYWNDVATVLIELVEEIDGHKLLQGTARVARTDVQRLGWLLDFIGEHQLADALAPALAGKRLLPTPLATYRTTDGAALDPRWKVLVNADVDPDL